MKILNRYTISFVVIIGFIFLIIFSFNNSTIEYSDFINAKKTKKVVQIIGSLNTKKTYFYDNIKNEFTFYLIDKNKIESKVVFHNSPPNNFFIAPMVVVKGKFIDSVFVSSEILTKCPSKYEGKMSEIENNK